MDLQLEKHKSLSTLEPGPHRGTLHMEIIVGDFKDKYIYICLICKEKKCYANIIEYGIFRIISSVCFVLNKKHALVNIWDLIH